MKYINAYRIDNGCEASKQNNKKFQNLMMFPAAAIIIIAHEFAAWIIFNLLL